MTTMGVNWDKERRLAWSILRWWLVTGLLAIPFGIVYGCAVRILHRESVPAALVCAFAALAVSYVIQGLFPKGASSHD
jgi:hypothetical protein